MELSTEERRHFILAEYHEASNAYFKGVEIGYTTVKSYITINGLFAALIGALAEPKSGVLAAASDLVKLVPWFALVASFALLAALRHYFDHLENCRKRCEDIERHFDGKLFTNLGSISTDTKRFHTGYGLRLIIWTIIAFWFYFALKTHAPTLGLWDAVKAMVS